MSSSTFFRTDYLSRDLAMEQEKVSIVEEDTGAGDRSKGRVSFQQVQSDS
jgi:hypothetical protein